MSDKHIITLFRIFCSVVLTATGIVFSIMLPMLTSYSVIFFILAAVIVGYDVLIDAINGLIHGHLLDENFLMTLGSICAFIVGEYPEGAAILTLYQVGELFQSIAVGKSRNSISELMNICPDEARLEDGSIADPFEVVVGDVILVEPGEKIPLDGVILSGESAVDTSSLTGEHQPRSLGVGDEIISGCINLTSPLKIRVTKEFSESTVSKILQLVENASGRKAKLEGFVTRFARYYTPAVVISALLVGLLPPLVFSAEYSVWLLRAVMFIVISCPCALVVSVPLSFFGALGAASKAGVLVKGSNYLEALASLDTVIFDKTGTLTEGKFEVCAVCPTQYVTEEELLLAAAFSEYHSSHPIAISLKEAAKSDYEPTDDMLYEDISGKGVRVCFGEKRLLCGNAELMREFHFVPLETPEGATAVHVAATNYLGYILLSDKLKASSKDALTALKSAGIKRVILSGDNEGAVSKINNAVDADEHYSSLLPADKVRIAEEIIEKSSGRVAFVGDGVNDAPVLARADVGIAMGALGSDAAIEAADVVIMNDDLTLISEAIKISKKAVRISKQNIAFSLIIKFSQLALSLVGLGTVWMAVFADVGVLILAIANSLRTLKK